MPKNAAGKHFPNKFAMNRHEKMESAPFEAGEKEGAKESPEDIQSVVAEHGPAQEIHIKHDHEAGKHHVKSHHESHVHESVHPSVEEAHAHALQAAGGGEQGQSMGDDYPVEGLD